MRYGAIILLFLTACGYSLQGSHSPLIEAEGIRRVYVEPLRNGTFKAGVENVVYNVLLRTISSGRRVILVNSAQEADAILSGWVVGASYAAAASSYADKLQPTNLGMSPSITVATTYSATLQCNFLLKRRIVPPKKKEELWSSSFSRSKFFAGSNQLDVLGTTSALINESDFDRALSDLAGGMMGDVHESMLAMF